jgi:guanylate cyclase
MGCGESFEGVAVGADMYHQQNVKAFIGPYCNAEMDAVRRALGDGVNGHSRSGEQDGCFLVPSSSPPSQNQSLLTGTCPSSATWPPGGFPSPLFNPSPTYSNIFSDKSIYKTLARVSLRTTNSLALATYSLVRHYNWNRVAIVTNTGPMAFERVQAFEEVFHARKITVVKVGKAEEGTWGMAGWLAVEGDVRGECGCQVHPGQWLHRGLAQFGQK